LIDCSLLLISAYFGEEEELVKRRFQHQAEKVLHLPWVCLDLPWVEYLEEDRHLFGIRPVPVIKTRLVKPFVAKILATKTKPNPTRQCPNCRENTLRME
jgi:hypothetical protein